KSAFIVVDDADIGFAAMIAGFTVCSHAGQGCAITTRLLVPEAQHDAIVEAVANTLAGVPYGDPRDPSTMRGPLSIAAQLDKVGGCVRRAVEDGAKVVTGGTRAEMEGALAGGYFYEPTLLTNVDPDSSIAQDEVFGPVLAVIPYRDDDEAVA